MEITFKWEKKKLEQFKKTRLVQIFHKDIFKVDEPDFFGNYDHLRDQAIEFDSLSRSIGVKTIWVRGEIYISAKYVADVIGIFAVEEV